MHAKWARAIRVPHLAVNRGVSVRHIYPPARSTARTAPARRGAAVEAPIPSSAPAPWSVITRGVPKDYPRSAEAAFSSGQHLPPTDPAKVWIPPP